MIQWYDDRPEGPEEAFIWFETLFRKQFLAEQASKERKLEYVLRLLVARRELQLRIFPQWPTEYTAEKLQNEIVAHFGREFDEQIFKTFEDEVFAALPKLKQIARLRAHSTPLS
jgi:hypothetical protein